MFVVPAARDSWSIAEFSQSEYVDFAVWVLTQTGMKVAPFDQHDEGFEHLRAIGIDGDSWEAWFRELVYFEHTASRLQREGITELIRERQEHLNYVPFIYNGLSVFESSLEQQGEGIFTRYYDTISRLSPFPQPAPRTAERESSSSPVMHWRGSASARVVLTDLWTQYRSRPYYRVHHVSDFQRLVARGDRVIEEINSRLYSLLEGQERFLMFHFVNYPTALYRVVGNSIVIGMDKDSPFSIDVMKAQMFAAVKCLLSS